jgi:hypothetical protein
MEIMMTDYMDDLVNQIKVVVGRSTATAFVTPETEDRFFIIESLLTGAALFLLNRYFAGFFKPVEEAGARHREAAVRLLEDLSNGSMAQLTNDAGRAAVQDTLTEAKALDTPERREAAEKEVQQVLLEYGESEAFAAKKASEITDAIFRR